MWTKGPEHGVAQQVWRVAQEEVTSGDWANLKTFGRVVAPSGDTRGLNDRVLAASERHDGTVQGRFLCVLIGIEQGEVGPHGGQEHAQDCRLIQELLRNCRVPLLDGVDELGVWKLVQLRPVIGQVGGTPGPNE